MTSRLLTALFASTLLAGPALAQSTDVSGEITFMAYAGMFQEKYTAAVIEPFQKAYPNVKVNFFSQPGSSQILGALRSQAADPQADVVLFDVSTSLIGNTEGLLAPITAETVPNIADLLPEAIVAEGYGTAVTFDNLVVTYNTENVKTPPTSIGAFWDPAYAGRTAVSAMPSILGTGMSIITSAWLGEDYTKSIAQSTAKLAELAPSVQTFEPKPDSYTLVLNGTVDLATGWNARSQTYAIESGGKLGVMVPSVGSILQINTINLVKGAKNEAAALAFINYVLSAEAQAAFTEAMFYAPVNAKAVVSDEAKARTITGDLDKMLPVDWAWAATVTNEWTQIWRRQIISAGN